MMPEKSKYSRNKIFSVIPFSLVTLKFQSETDLSFIGPKAYIIWGITFEKKYSEM